MQTLLWIIALVLVVVGIAGTVLPALPGMPLIFGGLLLAAYSDDFQRVGTWPLVTLGILTVLSFAVDYVAAMLGAKRAGASKLALVGAALGTLFGLALGLVGVLIGPFIGAAVGEFIDQQNLQRAGKVGLQTWIGLLLGSAAKLAIAFTMIGIFALAYWW